MKRSTTVLGIGLLVVAAACGKKREQEPAPQPAPPVADVPAPEPPERGAPKPTASVFVAHEVEAFDAWKQKFDENTEVRKAASVVWHSVARDVDDENLVYIHLVGTDAAKLQQLVGSEDLARVMAEAGVKGKPTVWLAHDVETFSPAAKLSGETYSIFARHAVEEFDQWKAAFDADAEVRRTAMGVLGGSVSRSIDDANMVVMHFMVPDAARVTEAMSSDEMKRKMAEAGVKGAPELHVGRDVETSSYE